MAQAQALERTSDPFEELACMLGGHRMNDRFWRDTMADVAVALHTLTAPVRWLTRR